MGQLFENFVISELEKRRKLGYINCEQFYYYKSAAGKEIDLVFESENTLYAVEIKSVKSPSLKDISALSEFIKYHQNAKGYLFYLGNEFRLIPFSAENKYSFFQTCFSLH
jgi:hypothetical protein